VVVCGGYEGAATMGIADNTWSVGKYTHGLEWPGIISVSNKIYVAGGKLKPEALLLMRLHYWNGDLDLQMQTGNYNATLNCNSLNYYEATFSLPLLLGQLLPPLFLASLDYY
jgi:hypothetical protein